jgi:hypothetical protein
MPWAGRAVLAVFPPPNDFVPAIGPFLFTQLHSFHQEDASALQTQERGNRGNTHKVIVGAKLYITSGLRSAAVGGCAAQRSSGAAKVGFNHPSHSAEGGRPNLTKLPCS